MTTRKLLKEEFAKFYETPTRDNLRELLKNNFGEFPNLDFKEQWLPFPQIARREAPPMGASAIPLAFGTVLLSPKFTIFHNVSCCFGFFIRFSS